MNAKWIAASVLMLVDVCCAAVWGLRSIPVSYVYAFRAKYTVLPTNDEAFAQWLATQPGVVRANANRNGDEISVTFIMSQSAIGPRTPPIPDFDRELTRLGYKDRVYFKKE